MTSSSSTANDERLPPAAGPVTPPQPQPQRKKGKKRKISKHIVEAASAKNGALPTAASNETPAVGATTTKQGGGSSSSKQKKGKVKDPADVAAYLTAWKEKQETWKFNKNTQSWLVRQMYQSEKVGKATFAILVDYLAAGDAKTVDRVVQDATRRALRYQSFIKENPPAVVATDDKDKQEETEKRQDGDASAPVSTEKEPQEDVRSEEKRWQDLSDHDKRKEYKRARKVLDTLSAES